MFCYLIICQKYYVRLGDLLQWTRKLGKHNIADFPIGYVFDLNLASKSQSVAQAKKAHVHMTTLHVCVSFK